MKAARLRIISTTLVCILSAFFSACATLPSDAPAFSMAPSAPEGYGTVYFYRVGAPPPLRKPDVFVSEIRVYEPPELAYTWVHVKAGVKRFRIEWSDEIGISPVDLVSGIAAGESYYIKISGSWRQAFGGHTVMSSSMQLVSPPKAQAELSKCCKYIMAEVARID